MTNGLLTGLRVADFSRVLAGPFCSMILADLGADIIKVESPNGDETRRWGPPFQGDLSAYFAMTNRNKRSVVIDLSQEYGREAARRIIQTSDVVIQNFKVGDAKKFGISYEDLQLERPDLVYASISGYGQTGERCHQPGYDFIAQAMSGLMSITGPVEGSPYKTGVAIVDVVTGLYAAIGILGALYKVRETGIGDHVDVSLADSALTMLINVAASYLMTGTEPKKYGNAHPSIAPYETLRVQDGQIALAVGTDDQFRKLMRVLGRESLADDERFRTNVDRVEHRGELIPILERLLTSQPADRWLKQLEAVKVPCGKVRSVAEAVDEARSMDTNMVWSTETRHAGALELIGSAIHLVQHPATLRTPPPLLGEHTEEVLKELGYTVEQVKAMMEPTDPR